MPTEIKFSSTVYDVDICTRSCGDKLVLGIHSNTSIESSQNQAGDESASSDGYTGGHAWISLNLMDEAGSTRYTYYTVGVWPDGHPRIQTDPKYSAKESDTDIRFNMENSYTPSRVADRYANIPNTSISDLERHLERNITWGYTENCSGFAVDTWNTFVPHDRLDANDYVWFIETPRELGRSINKKENEKKTSLTDPI